MAAPGKKSFCVLEYHASNSVVAEQLAFRAKYAKDPPTDNTIPIIKVCLDPSQFKNSIDFFTKIIHQF